MKHGLAVAIALILVVVAAIAWSLRTEPRATAAPPAQVEAAVPAQPVAEPSEIAELQAPHVEAASPERESAASPEPPASTEGAPQSQLLLVRVVDSDTRLPIAGERLLLRPTSAMTWSVAHIDGSHAKPEQSPRTDADGRASFEAPAGTELFLAAIERDTPGAHLAIDPLAPGETREVEFAIEPTRELAMFVRVVDDETKVEIAGGSIAFSRGWGRDETERVDAHGGGVFELRSKQWRRRLATARAEGYAEIRFALEEGHASVADALEVRLKRGATLEVVVLEHGAALANLGVFASTDGYHLLQRNELSLSHFGSDDRDWHAKTDATGVAVFRDLPPGAPLTIKVDARERESHTAATDLELAPGEHRRFEINLGSGATIAGRVVDRAGVALESVDVWRAKADHAVPTLLRSYEKPVARARSDANGSFRFDDVPVGLWNVGPAREQPGEIVGVAQPVDVVAQEGAYEVVLVIDRALYLAGAVVGPDGSPVASAHVSVRSESASIYESEMAGDTGEFRIGPLPAGEYVLQTGGVLTGFAPSAPVRAHAGTSGITLVVAVGARLKGTIVDAAGAPAACDIMLLCERDEFGMTHTATDRGVFEFKGLTEGAYTVIARSSKAIGCSGRIVVAQGETREGIAITMRPGATLELVYTGPEPFATCIVASDGGRVGWEWVEKNAPKSVTVPAGNLELSWSLPESGASVARVVSVASGATATATWDGSR